MIRMIIAYEHQEPIKIFKYVNINLRNKLILEKEQIEYVMNI